MWIITDNQQTQRLFDAELMDKPVEFHSNGTAQVTDDVGKALCDHYDTIRPYEADD